MNEVEFNVIQTLSHTDEGPWSHLRGIKQGEVAEKWLLTTIDDGPTKYTVNSPTAFGSGELKFVSIKLVLNRISSTCLCLLK